MKTKISMKCIIAFFLLQTWLPLNAQNSFIEVIKEFNVGQNVGFLRAVPVNISAEEKGLLLVYSADKSIDPWMEMFYIPTDYLKFALYDLDGNLIWKKAHHKGVINGEWFVPIFPFDLDKDGSDEIYFVHNTDSVHIISYFNQKLEALDSRTGNTIGQWPWNHVEVKNLMHRNFIFGGYDNGEPVLITAQGTYFSMGLQAWSMDMEQKWTLRIDENAPGARGSHMCPVVDINNDGVDEMFWGERCISVANGEYLFIADEKEYNGHSDVIQPTLNRESDTWSFFTCRESGEHGEITPRIVMFDDKGQRLWTDLDVGHMDMGWTAHVAKNQIIAFSISRGKKIAGPDGFRRENVKEYVYDAATGNKIQLGFNAYNSIPVDLNGDGFHEFAVALGEQADRKLYEYNGNEIGFLGNNATIAIASNFMELNGEQILCYYPDGTIKIWADTKAKHSKVAKKRYLNPYYKLMQRFTAVGYNLVELGGL